MKRSHRQFIERGRSLLLSQPGAVAHGLLCPRCGLRPQALLSLALVEWTEDDFFAAYQLRMPSEGDVK